MPPSRASLGFRARVCLGEHLLCQPVFPPRGQDVLWTPLVGSLHSGQEVGLATHPGMGSGSRGSHTEGSTAWLQTAHHSSLAGTHVAATAVSPSPVGHGGGIEKTCGPGGCPHGWDSTSGCQLPAMSSGHRRVPHTLSPVTGPAGASQHPALSTDFVLNL